MVARRTRRREEERKRELVLITAGIIVLVVFLSPFFSPSVSGQLSLSDIFPFLKGTDIGKETAERQPVSTCENGIRDGSETDVDCGGVCPSCELSQNCKRHSDCESNSCDPILKVCDIASCDDNTQNGDETGVDCGGECYPCYCYNSRLDNTRGEDKIDCSTKTNTCPTCDIDGYPPHCSDNIQNAGETVGVDCGGSCAFLGMKNPQTCYTHEQACLEAGFWWCDKKAKCLPGPVSDCISNEDECEKNGFFWCDLYSTCYDEKAYWCMTDEISCEAEGFFWCDKFNYCIDYTYCNCYQTQQECKEDESCSWKSGAGQQCILSSWASS